MSKLDDILFSKTDRVKMKKLFKKSLAVFLSVVIALSVASVAFANFDSSTETQGSEEIVATMYLCACVYVFPVSGHTWIYVENNTDHTLRVGLYDVPAGQGVSIGAFSFSVADGWGIYYNLEAFRENNKDREDIAWSIPEEMTAAFLPGQALTALC